MEPNIQTEEQTPAPRSRVRNDIDFNLLPPEAFLKISDVLILTCMSRGTLEKMLREGEFPTPAKVGRDRCWPWGEVRDWLRLAGEKGDE